MTAMALSAALLGRLGRPASVEFRVSNGLLGCNVVGAPDAECRESHDRVRTALAGDAVVPVGVVGREAAQLVARRFGAALVASGR